jgi:hypothetical protein
MSKHQKPQCFDDPAVAWASEPVRNFLLHPLDRPTDRPALWTSKPKVLMQCKRQTTTIRTYLVRILHLHYKTTCFPWINEGSGTTLATLETTH